MIPDTPADAARTKSGGAASLAQALHAVFFGYDYFISYRTADAAHYARSLEAGLRARKFDCFLDERHYEAGNKLTWMQSRALRRSTKLLVVVSPGAHLSPATRTDWLLSEVREFKELARHRGRRPAIVPIGTPATLSPDVFPASRLLPEIPSPATGDICLFDPASDQNGAVAPATLDKLENDFREFRRRQARLLTGWGVLLVLGVVAALGAVAQWKKVRAEREAALGDAYRLMERGRENLARSNGVDAALDLFGQSAERLERLGRDPVMALHGRFAGRLRKLRAEPIAEVDREVSRLILSADGDWVLVTQDYQAPNGSPDMDDIPEANAFGVFHISERKWTLRRTVGSEIGRYIYLRQPGEIVAFEPPDHVVVHEAGAEGTNPFRRLSLVDGAGTEVPAPAAVASPAAPPRTETAKARVEALLAPAALFTTDPHDGIDIEYGRRLVGETYVEAPAGRTALVGTYEGRLMLVDLVAGLSRGEMATNTIYAAAYRPDGMRGYFCDQTHLWEVDASGCPGVTELAVTLHKSPDNPWKNEKVLATALDDEAAVLALATTERLLCHDFKSGRWREWPWPHPVEAMAALRVDGPRACIDGVIADDGMIVTVRHQATGTRLETRPRPGAPERTVAWLDGATPVAWLAGTKTARGGADIWAVPLPGEPGAAVEWPVPRLQPGEATGDDDTLAVHALTREGDDLVLIHGDVSSTEDGRALHNEQIMRIPRRPGAKPSTRTLFATESRANGPDHLWTCQQATAVQPGAAAGTLLVQTDGAGMRLVGLDGQSTPIPGNLAARAKQATDQAYLIGVDRQDGEAWIEIRHLATGTALRYQLPWAYEAAPGWAYLTPSGRQAVLVSEKGDILMMDAAPATPPVQAGRGEQ